MRNYIFLGHVKPKPEPTSFFKAVNNYPVGKATTSWGCTCPKCGAFHEFTRGRGWNFCPTCGCNAKE